jgi:serine/threonine protein kinase
MAFDLGRCPDENMLVMLAEGVLEGPDRSAVDRHLDGCPECSQLVGHLARLAAPGRPAPQRYKVIRQIGEGAMGVVWEAEDTSLSRRVALKFVRPEGADNRALRKRLLREARALAQVRHPNVVSVYDAGEADDEVCLVLELVIGTNARAWRNARPRGFDEIFAVWRQAAAGVAAVHRAGIVHRDIKPDNVLVADTDGRVLVGDFGLATGDFGLTTTTNITASGKRSWASVRSAARRSRRSCSRCPSPSSCRSARIPRSAACSTCCRAGSIRIPTSDIRMSTRSSSRSTAR